MTAHLTVEQRQLARRLSAKGLSLRWHFVDAPKEVRRARVAVRNAAKGETFVMEVTPEMFEMLEAIYEPPVPAELSTRHGPQSPPRSA